MSNEIKIVAAILAHIRGEITASYVADLFGVTEVQVHGWKDVFQVAGVVALANELKSRSEHCEHVTDDDGEPTTTPRPRTTHPIRPTTTRRPTKRHPHS